MTIRKLIASTQKVLIQHAIPETYVKYVLNELLLVEDKNLYDVLDETLSDDLQIKFDLIIERLLKDEPLAYVMGVQYFYGYAFDVNPSVLIPRFETEELVLRVLMELDEHFQEDCTLLDIGTGSGAIACVLKKEKENMNVYASDISFEALEQAQKNAQKLNVDIQFYQGDMAQPFIDHQIVADVLVCNPPYIPQDEVIENSVKDYEPHVALFGGNDGLYFYRLVLKAAPLILNKKSMIAFEMGWNQKESLSQLVKEVFPEAQIECFQDLAMKDRILIVRNF